MSKSKKTKSNLFTIKEVSQDELFPIIEAYDKKFNNRKKVVVKDLKEMNKFYYTLLEFIEIDGNKEELIYVYVKILCNVMNALIKHKELIEYDKSWINNIIITVRHYIKGIPENEIEKNFIKIGHRFLQLFDDTYKKKDSVDDSDDDDDELGEYEFT
jgi:hypothetical protein